MDQDLVAGEEVVVVGIKFRSQKQGQAMVEMLIGLVALVVLIAIMAQLGSLVQAQHESMRQARARAGALAFQPAPVSASARFIGATDVGEDGVPYTRDDVFRTGDPAAFQRAVFVTPAGEPNGWRLLDPHPNQALMRVRNAENPAAVFGLLRGEASVSVTLLPAVRHLLYRRDSLQIQDAVWMPWIRGIY